MRLGAREPIAALNRVCIVESGEPLVDIRIACPGIVIREECCPFLRTTVAAMLLQASSALPDGFRFYVSTAMRTLAIQRDHWDTYFRRMQEEHPQWPLATLRRATNRFFAPYDQPAPPGHCTGGAVDVLLVDTQGEPIDVTSPLDRWTGAYTWTDRISPEARSRRMVLVDSMLRAGFSNCREEFWHYSYGDSAWAVRTGRTECPYGLAAPPALVEAAFTNGRAGSIERTGESEWACRPIIPEDGGSPLTIGILWSAGSTVTVRLSGMAGASFGISADRHTWKPVLVEIDGADAVAHITPEVDRLFLAAAQRPSAPETH